MQHAVQGRQGASLLVYRREPAAGSQRGATSCALLGGDQRFSGRADRDLPRAGPRHGVRRARRPGPPVRALSPGPHPADYGHVGGAGAPGPVAHLPPAHLGRVLAGGSTLAGAPTRYVLCTPAGRQPRGHGLGKGAAPFDALSVTLAGQRMAAAPALVWRQCVC